MIQHMVMLKFKPGVESADIDALEAHMEELANRIVEIQSYEFGRDVARTERSFDFGLVSLFANMEAVGRYQVHPDHLELLERIRSICDRVVTVDFQYDYKPAAIA